VLHNHQHDGTLHDGDLVLLDAGAEVASGYGCDVTRTWPASGEFSAEARDVYETVLRAQRAAIRAVRDRARFRDVHFRAAEVIAEGLVELGILRGAVQDLVARGAHALFFPHGVGHFLGLDAHDLESFGDRILYGEGRRRSEEFGTAFLRIDRDLEPGMVVTVEPGIYFVPAILHHREFREKFAGDVDFERAERYLESNAGRGFGGVRIEDDVLTTESEPEVLTSAIPKEIGELEEIVGRTVAPTQAS
jgi:Xaa-Pro aminopeptidase